MNQECKREFRNAYSDHVLLASKFKNSKIVWLTRKNNLVRKQCNNYNARSNFLPAKTKLTDQISGWKENYKIIEISEKRCKFHTFSTTLNWAPLAEALKLTTMLQETRWPCCGLRQTSKQSPMGLGENWGKFKTEPLNGLAGLLERAQMVENGLNFSRLMTGKSDFLINLECEKTFCYYLT